jgi:hypothetical protein
MSMKNSHQPASAGFSPPALAIQQLPIIIHPDFFQPPFRRPPRMMLLLIRDVFPHPRQLLLAKADDAETKLPLQAFHAQLLVDFPRARPFPLTDKVANAKVRLNANRHVNMKCN